ncbi:MAG: hypothetical protein KGS72_03310 [Cyanobacteria bacterium REEB67]|nr:hypothetical protein [Cyanobacteria bacterium REEB67]
MAVSGGLFTWIFATGFLGYTAGFMVGCIAAGMIWHHYSEKDKALLAALLDPPEEIFAAPLPVVWGSILDTFNHS